MALQFQCPDCDDIIPTKAPVGKEHEFKAKSYPGILQAIWLLVLLFLIFIVVGISIVTLSRILHVERHTIVLSVPLISMGIMVVYGFKKTNASCSGVFPFRSFPVVLLIPLVLTMIGVSIIGSEIDNLFRTVFPIPEEIAAILTDIARARIGLWRTILFTVILVPLVEEMFFRGLVLRGFLSRYGVAKAIIVSALLFAVAHRNPWQFFGAAIGGTILAWVFVNTRSLLPCIFFHALNNVLPLLLITIFHLEIRGYTSEFTHVPQLQPLWFDIVGVVLAGLGIWLSIRIFRREKHFR